MCVKPQFLRPEENTHIDHKLYLNIIQGMWIRIDRIRIRLHHIWSMRILVGSRTIKSNLKDTFKIKNIFSCIIWRSFLFLFLRERKKLLVYLLICPLFYTPGSGSLDSNECGSYRIRIHISALYIWTTQQLLYLKYEKLWFSSELWTILVVELSQYLFSLQYSTIRTN